MRGKFIVIEGIDGSGLSTQAVKLENYLREKGIKVVLTKEPTDSLIGGLIKAALKKEWKVDPIALQLLFAADRAFHVNTEIVPALLEGKSVISDRYYFSSFAYGEAQGLDVNFLKVVNSKFQRPDLLIILDVPPEVSIERIKKARFGFTLFEEKEYLRKVRDSFKKIFMENKDIAHLVDGTKSIEEVHKEIKEIVEKKLKI